MTNISSNVISRKISKLSSHEMILTWKDCGLTYHRRCTDQRLDNICINYIRIMIKRMSFYRGNGEKIQFIKLYN